MRGEKVSLCPVVFCFLACYPWLLLISLLTFPAKTSGWKPTLLLLLLHCTARVLEFRSTCTQKHTRAHTQNIFFFFFIFYFFSISRSTLGKIGGKNCSPLGAEVAEKAKRTRRLCFQRDGATVGKALPLLVNSGTNLMLASQIHIKENMQCFFRD